MANPSRLTKIGLSGKTGTAANINDPYIKTVEFPITVVASAAEQDTGIAAPTGSMQVISAYLKIGTVETTGATKTVAVGIVGQAAVCLAATSVASGAVAGTPVSAVVVGGANFSYTLGSNDFAELVATCVVTYQGIDA